MRCQSTVLALVSCSALEELVMHVDQSSLGACVDKSRLGTRPVRCVLAPGHHTIPVLGVSGGEQPGWLAPMACPLCYTIAFLWPMRTVQGLLVGPYIYIQHLRLAASTWLTCHRGLLVLSSRSAADEQGGLMSLSAWASSGLGINLGSGIIADPQLAPGGPGAVNWTGAQVTLNVGERYFTWTRQVLTHQGGQVTYDP
eukprot:gene8336-7649_t